MSLNEREATLLDQHTFQISSQTNKLISLGLESRNATSWKETQVCQLTPTLTLQNLLLQFTLVGKENATIASTIAQ